MARLDLNRGARQPKPAAGSEPAAAGKQTLALRLVALAVGVYVFRLLLGLFRYALDAALLVLLAAAAAAIAGPGLKNDTVSQLLGQLEALVDPLFAAIADRGASAVSGPARTIASYLGIGPAPARA
ncbi:hypothetical protein H4R21_004451 [Coemansia helicoidea]|uniref:Uncharacterized protein n=1 Tax=Coemansia helicoidea TaxID=1286919 RepID=A0ACC1KY32_9FUNG|nr:hypothetical protein H4R21_004451 [Coemansia helicoidea]